MKTLKDFKNELLKRRELKVLTSADSNPGFENSKQLIAKEFKANEDLIVVKNVKSKFGRDTFLVDAYIYNSVDDRGKIEPTIKVKKGAGEAK